MLYHYYFELMSLLAYFPFLSRRSLKEHGVRHFKMQFENMRIVWHFDSITVVCFYWAHDHDHDCCSFKLFKCGIRRMGTQSNHLHFMVQICNFARVFSGRKERFLWCSFKMNTAAAIKMSGISSAMTFATVISQDVGFSYLLHIREKRRNDLYESYKLCERTFILIGVAGGRPGLDT